MALLTALCAIIVGFAIFTEAKTMKDDGLNAKQTKIVTIAAFTANGNLEKLKTALNEGLDAGLSVNEIKEILVQMYAYAGFPRSLNGINTFMAVMDERQSKGIKDDVGKEASSVPANMNKNDYGAKVRAMLSGQEKGSPPGGIQLFTPVIDTFLKEHLFADIFCRDILDYQSRELATISALASMTGTAGQLEFHLGAAMNTGLTEAQMKDFITALKSKVGEKEADKANEILSKVLGDRKTITSQTALGAVAPLETSNVDSQTISITRNGSLPSIIGLADHFTGSVHIDPLFKAHDPSRVTGGRVTFEPGARTAWHSHPYGQYLIVVEGSGRVQRWGGPIEEIKAGDVVWFPPGLKHWHGADPDNRMTHIAIQEEIGGKNVDWMEKVSDEQYLAKLTAP
jgi:4-carboxymuconolactone decarboxylase